MNYLRSSVEDGEIGQAFKNQMSRAHQDGAVDKQHGPEVKRQFLLGGFRQGPNYSVGLYPVRDLLTNSRTFTFILAVGLFAMAARNVTDPDFWWHLKTGQLIARDHRLFYADPFSSTRSGHPWLNHEWLPDLLIFALHSTAGIGCLIVAFAAVISSAFMLLYWRSLGKPYAAGICTLLGALTALPSWGVRPQMLAFLLASLLLLFLERSETETRLIWWVVPLMWVWVNSHASFPVGLVVIAGFLVAECGEAWLQNTWTLAAGRVARLGIVLAASVAVVPLNPYGFRLFAYPLQTLSSDAMQEFIAEWASPDFHRTEYAFLLIMLLGLIAAATFSGVRMKLRELVLLVPATLGALISARHIYFFVLIAAPVLARACAEVCKLFRPFSASGGKKMLNASLMAGLVLFAVLRIYYVVRQQPGAEAAHFPEKMVQFVRANPLPANGLNYYNWGGYMIWELYPGYRVFVDGRADIYGDEFLERYANAYYLTDKWDDLLTQYGVQAVVLPPDAPLVTGLTTLKHWRVVYRDDQSVIVAR